MAKKAELADGSEGLICYVCDATVVGWYHYLNREITMYQKLNEILGEEYMTVITEADVICRGCSATIRSLEKKEKEVSFMKSKVRRNLVKKYGLEEETKSEKQPQSRSDAAKSRARTLCKTGRGKIWIRCDQCDYKTNYNAFMVYHIRTNHLNQLEEKVQEKEGTTSKEEDNENTTVVRDNGETHVDITETEIIQNPGYDYGDTSFILEEIDVDNEITIETTQSEDNNNVICFVDNNDEQEMKSVICDVPVVTEEEANDDQRLYELIDEFF